MATEIKIPNVGESITSANVAHWHKQNGEAVTKGETVLTIETDKVSNDLEADAAGVLKILVQEGEEVAIGTVVGIIEEGGPPEVTSHTGTKKADPQVSRSQNNNQSHNQSQSHRSQLISLQQLLPKRKERCLKLKCLLPESQSPLPI